MIVLEGGAFAHFKSFPRGLSPGGMVLDEIDSCISQAIWRVVLRYEKLLIFINPKPEFGQ